MYTPVSLSSSLVSIRAHNFPAPVTITICKRSPPSEYFWGFLFGAILEVPPMFSLYA
jgi:hypothetical protein